MSNLICIHLANAGEEYRTVTVEDLCALHLPRYYPLVQGVLAPRERRSIQVARDEAFRGIAFLGSGCIRVFYSEGMVRTLTVCEGDAVEV